MIHVFSVPAGPICRSTAHINTVPEFDDSSRSRIPRRTCDNEYRAGLRTTDGEHGSGATRL